MADASVLVRVSVLVPVRVNGARLVLVLDLAAREPEKLSQERIGRRMQRGRDCIGLYFDAPVG